mgnify:CR=1 FL=1
MWFPELFNRFDEFSRLRPNETASVCIVTDFVVNMGSQQDGAICNEKISQSVFMVAAALPSNVIAVLGMDRLGRKFFLGKSFDETRMKGFYVIVKSKIHRANQKPDIFIKNIFTET